MAFALDLKNASISSNSEISLLEGEVMPSF